MQDPLPGDTKATNWIKGETKTVTHAASTQDYATSAKSATPERPSMVKKKRFNKSIANRNRAATEQTKRVMGLDEDDQSSVSDKTGDDV